MMKRCALALLMVICSFLEAGAVENAQEVLDRVRKKYDSMVDAQIKFSQTSRFELSKVEQTVSGLLLLKKEHKYRVEYDDQTIVTDGETVWKYSASQKQVLIDHFKMDDQTFSPERILTGAPSDYTPVVLKKERLGKAETTVLKLTAVHEDSYVQSLKLWVDEGTWLIRKVEYVDVSGKRTDYTVNDIRINIGLDDSRFTYKVPEGVEVVDLR